MFVRMAKTRKTFMPTIIPDGRHTREALGQYPGLGLPRRGRAGRFAGWTERRLDRPPL
jgi:hypothetical protein